MVIPKQKISIAVDVMTAESGLPVAIEAAVTMLKRDANLKLHLVGDKLLIEEVLESCHRAYWRELNLEIHHSEVAILQNDDPVWALKNKKGSSTHQSVRLVSEGRANAVVSCANTGALVAISRFMLKRLNGVEKLALVGGFPTYGKKDVYICDVGASFDASPQDLLCQAKMASAMLNCGANATAPKIGLLNMATEDSKGNLLAKEATTLLRQDESLNFYGSIEGHDIFKGHVDIVICDGFVGNCVLKSCEGTANFVMNTIRKACMNGALTKIIGSFMRQVLKKQAPKLNPSLRNGALVLGLNGIVIKSHGHADLLGIETAIQTAVSACKSSYIENIAARTPEEALID